ATAVTISVGTAAVGAEARAALFATYGDSSARGAVQLEPPQPASLSVEPARLIGGLGANATVTLTGSAPAGGFTVALTSRDAAAAVPPSVVVAAGATSATFPVSTRGVAAEDVVMLGAGTATATLTVEPASLVTLSIGSPAATRSIGASVSLDGL